MPANTAPTFVPGGFVTTSFYHGGSVNRLFVQADGSVLVAGGTGTSSGHSGFGILKFLADGNLDPSFGNGTGEASTPIDNLNFVSSAVITQSDGKILVAGTGSNAQNQTTELAVARYNSDGSLDTSFGAGTGRVTRSVAQGASVNDLLLQSDGKIIVAGNTLTRYNPDGSLDISFGQGTGAVAGEGPTGTAGLEPDGKIVVAGISGGTLVATRYTASGELDSSFGSGGTVASIPPLAPSGTSHLSILADGKILVATTGGGFGTHDFELARYTADGHLDTSFGGGTGYATADFGGDDSIASVTAQADGKIVVVGTGYTQHGAIEVARFTADGALDTSYGGGDGKVEVTLPLPTQFSSGAADASVLPDGSILVLGFSPTLVRLTPEGSLDLSLQPMDSLGGTKTYHLNAPPVVLSDTVVVFDQQLSDQGSYAGAVLKLERAGGPDPSDVFGTYGGTLVTGGAFTAGSIVVGTVNQNSGGTLIVTFNDNYLSYIDGALENLTYTTTSSTLGTVDIAWTISDGNSGAQGTGGALIGTGVSHVNVVASNSPPSGGDSAITTLWKSTYSFSLADFKFSDADSNNFTGVVIDSLPSAGLLVDNGHNVTAGEFISASDIFNHLFKFVSGDAPDASFTFQVRDDGGTVGSGIEIDPTPNTVSFNRNGDDLMFGTAFPDNIQGGGGNDRLVGGGDADLLTGGLGQDVFLYFRATDSTPTRQDIITDFQTGIDKIDIASIGVASLSIVRNGASSFIFANTNGGFFQLGVTGSIQATDLSVGGLGVAMVGDGDANTLIGAGGGDTITGGAGTDFITGNGGGDVLIGGSDADTFRYLAASDSTASAWDLITDFVSGSDRIDLTAVAPSNIAIVRSGEASFVFAETSGGTMQIGVLGSIQGGDILAGGAGVDMVGDGGANTLIGSAMGDRFAGGAGTDFITGNGGGDLLSGGADGDTFRYLAASDSTASGSDIITDFESGSDRIDLSAVGPSAVAIVRLGSGSFVFANTPDGAMQIGVIGTIQGGDIETGGVSVDLVGDGDANTLTGSATGNAIYGNDGNDTLTGKGGADLLAGGAGADTFVFAAGDSISGASDIITDFQTGIDHIDLRGSGYTQIGLATLGSATFLFAQGTGLPDLVVGSLNPIALNDVLVGPAPAPHAADFIA